jgi:protocatechuate 3,4-dioxygenase beta subunit
MWDAADRYPIGTLLYATVAPRLYPDEELVAVTTSREAPGDRAAESVTSSAAEPAAPSSTSYAARRDAAMSPPYRVPDLKSSALRAPAHEPVAIPLTPSEATGPGPVLAGRWELLNDLTRSADGGEAIGERIIVTGRVLTEDGRGLPDTVIEIWQANAAGRYRTEVDRHDAPLDPNFTGVGRLQTDAAGTYRMLTIRPGAYPWKNHPNAWRPAHVHFSLFGPSMRSRLVTQMYFPGDPLLPLDPIFMAVPAEARGRLLAAYDHSITQEAWALGFLFDIVLAGPRATPADPVV